MQLWLSTYHLTLLGGTYQAKELNEGLPYDALENGNIFLCSLSTLLYYTYWAQELCRHLKTKMTVRDVIFWIYASYEMVIKKYLQLIEWTCVNA